MTKQSAFLALCAVFLATEATAQSSRLVRSGEHSTYSRLVIPMAEAQPWEMRTTGRRTELIVPGWEGEFDISTVFDRIPKTRILSLNSKTEDGDTRLLMSLGCACEVKASISGQYVVIDVVEAETEFEDFNAGSRQASRDPDTTRAEADALANAEDIAADDQPDLAAENPPAEDLAGAVDGRDPALAEGEMAEVARPVPATREETDPIADRLIKQLEAAAKQGIVELQKPKEPAPIAPEPEPEPEMVEAPPGLEAEERNLDSLEDFAKRFQDRLSEDGMETVGSVRVTAPKGSITKSGGNHETAVAEKPEDPANCLPDEALDAERWVGDEPYIDQLNALRANLIGEFDKPDPYAVRDLARFYIGIGFGIEARALLQDLEVELDDRDILMELAAAAEGAPHVPGGAFHQATGCPGLTAMWRTIVIDQGEDQPVQNGLDIVEDFADLPVEIRRQFGPRLVGSFINRDQMEEANLAFSVLDRAPGHHGAEHEMMRARLLHLDGRLDEAEVIYVDLYAQGAENAPEALVRLANLYFETGRPIPAEMMIDLETEATKYRYEAIGPELRLVEIRAKAGSRHMSDALDIVKAQLGTDAESDGAYMAAADRILRATQASDIGSGTYASTIFTHSDLVVHPDIRTETQHHVASELVGIGLPEPALGILIRPLEEGYVDADLTAATAHMAMDNPDAALAALKGSSPEHKAARGRALASLGRHGDAFAAVRGAGAAADTAMFAWRAGEWQFAAAAEAEPIQSFARYMIARDLGADRPPALPGDPPSPEEQSGFAQRPVIEEDVTLAGANGVYEQSRKSREVIAEALKQF